MKILFLFSILLPVLALDYLAAIAGEQIEVGGPYLPNHFMQTLQQRVDSLPSYTCSETIEKERLTSPIPVPPSMACAALSDSPDWEQRATRLIKQDKLRVQVALFSGTELFKWPTGHTFIARRLEDLTGSGSMSSGGFGSFLLGILENGDSLHYLGTETHDGGSRALFSYRVPAAQSHYTLAVAANDLTVAYSGKLSFDLISGELAELTVHVDQFPSQSQLCRLDIHTLYAKSRFGAKRVLLATESHLRMLDSAGNVSRNHSVYSDCLEYHAESQLVAPGAIHPVSEIRKRNLIDNTAVKAKRPVLLSTLTAIGPDSIAGDKIEARVLENVHDDAGHTVIPRGSIVSGTLVRFEERFSPAHYFVVGLAFEELVLPDRAAPVHLAALSDNALPILHGPQRGLQLMPVHAPIGSYSVENRPWVGNFLIRSRGPLHLAPGFKSRWLLLPD